MARKPALRGLLIDDATKIVTDGLGQPVNMNINSITASAGLSIAGNLTINGAINATDYNIISSSVIYATGSSQLGDSTTDVQTLIGTTKISGSLEVTGSSKFNDVILLSDAGLMFASDGGQDSGINWQADGVLNVRINNTTVGQFTSAGYTGTAATASYVLNAVSASYAPNTYVNPQYGTTATTSGSISYDCSSNKKVHVHTASPVANWTANFTGLTLSATSENTIKLVVPTGDPAYIPTVIQIDGVAKSITKSAIKGDKNKTNIHTYTILGNGTYVYGDTGNGLV